MSHPSGLKNICEIDEDRLLANSPFQLPEKFQNPEEENIHIPPTLNLTQEEVHHALHSAHVPEFSDSEEDIEQFCGFSPQQEYIGHIPPPPASILLRTVNFPQPTTSQQITLSDNSQSTPNPLYRIHQVVTFPTTGQVHPPQSNVQFVPVPPQLLFDSILRGTDNLLENESPPSELNFSAEPSQNNPIQDLNNNAPSISHTQAVPNTDNLATSQSLELCIQRFSDRIAALNIDNISAADNIEELPGYYSNQISNNNSPNTPVYCNLTRLGKPSASNNELISLKQNLIDNIDQTQIVFNNRLSHNNLQYNDNLNNTTSPQDFNKKNKDRVSSTEKSVVNFGSTNNNPSDPGDSSPSSPESSDFIDLKARDTSSDSTLSIPPPAMASNFNISTFHKSIPIYDGKTSFLNIFLDRCDSYHKNLNAAGRREFLANVIYKLEDRAHIIYKAKEPTDWRTLRNDLSAGIAEQKSIPTLQKELLSLRQNPGQSVTEFAEIIRRKLNTLSAKVKEKYDIPEVQRTFNEQNDQMGGRALKEGVYSSLKQRLISSQINSFEKLRQFALEEEPYVLQSVQLNESPHSFNPNFNQQFNRNNNNGDNFNFRNNYNPRNNNNRQGNYDPRNSRNNYMTRVNDRPGDNSRYYYQQNQRFVPNGNNQNNPWRQNTQPNSRMPTSFLSDNNHDQSHNHSTFNGNTWPVDPPLVQPNNSAPEQYNNQVTCHRCGRRGHIQRECYARLPDDPYQPPEEKPLPQRQFFYTDNSYRAKNETTDGAIENSVQLDRTTPK